MAATSKVSASMAKHMPAYTDTAGRAIHIKIHPRPLNMSESRRVLHQLGEFGEVVMYKHLKHEPELRASNTALAIFRTKDAAERCIGASPVRFGIDASAERHGGWQQNRGEEKQDAIGGYGSMGRGTNSIHENPNHHRIEAETASAAQNHSSTYPDPIHHSQSHHHHHKHHHQKTHFELHISPSTHNHAAYISRQHYTSRFTLNKRTVMGSDLEDRVPLPGLADCRLSAGEVPLRLRKLRMEEEKKEGRGQWKVGPAEMWKRMMKEEEEEDGERGGRYRTD